MDGEAVAMTQPAARRKERRAMAAILSVGVILVVGARLNGGASLDALRSRTNLIGGGGSLAPGSKYTATITFEDFVEFASVKSFLKSVGVGADDWSSYEGVKGYLPREITVELAASKVQGSLGVDAEDGHVFTAITYLVSGSTTFTSSWLLVMDLKGNLVQVTPTYGEYMQENGFESDKEYHRMVFQPLGLKMFNNTHVLVALDTGGISGPRALWDWKNDAWTTLCDGKENDAHDIQWAYEEAAVWQADGTTRVEAAAASSGKKRKNAHRNWDELSEAEQAEEAAKKGKTLISMEKFARKEDRRRAGRAENDSLRATESKQRVGRQAAKKAAAVAPRAAAAPTAAAPAAAAPAAAPPAMAASPGRQGRRRLLTPMVGALGRSGAASRGCRRKRLAGLGGGCSRSL